MRIVHRYLGYFMAGIMAVYAFSGIILIYRDTNFLKSEKEYHKVLDKNLNEKQLKTELKMKGLEITSEKDNVLYFKDGTYNKITGEADYKKMELPLVIDKMAKLHKSKSEESLSPLNVFFGVCLLFFVVSSFWMFNVKSKAFKRGLIYTGAGLILAILLLLIG